MAETRPRSLPAAEAPPAAGVRAAVSSPAAAAGHVAAAAERAFSRSEALGEGELRSAMMALDLAFASIKG
jgi:hypothetical protein